MKKKLPNILTITRIFLSIIVLCLIGLPWYKFNITWPSYMFGGKVVVELNYLISAVIFAIACLTDMLDGYFARKWDAVSDFGKCMDAIADKVLVNGVLIILAYNHNISLIIPVIIIIRDICVDAIKMVSASKAKVIGASIAGKIKTIFMMVGITLVLIGNIPFEFFNLAVDQGLILIATCLSIYSGIEYFLVNKDVFMGKE